MLLVPRLRNCWLIQGSEDHVCCVSSSSFGSPVQTALRSDSAVVRGVSEGPASLSGPVPSADKDILGLSRCLGSLPVSRPTIHAEV